MSASVVGSVAGQEVRRVDVGFVMLYCLVALEGSQRGEGSVYIDR